MTFQIQIKLFKMPKGGGRSVSYQGTNSSGSSYTCYEGGKGYTYSNQNGSSYYNTGSGHGFYK